MIDKKIIPALSFPIGAFGNHLRWLILLDEQYQFDIKLVDPESRGLYRTPDYINTCESYSFRSIESKLLFVNNYVYPENRTWHNWLVFEWKYRHLLQEIFPIEHAFDYEIENPTDKHLFLSVTPKLAYYSYLKFNSNLNNHSPSLFQEMINQWIQQAKLYCLKYQDHCLNLNGDILFNSVLDYDFYQTVTKFFNLDLKYDLANQIHNRWYHLHKKAEQELIIDLQNIYLKHTG